MKTSISKSTDLSTTYPVIKRLKDSASRYSTKKLPAVGIAELVVLFSSASKGTVIHSDFIGRNIGEFAEFAPDLFEQYNGVVSLTN